MREKPNLEGNQIIACLRDQYGVSAVSIEFLPIGYDSYAATYHVIAQDDRHYFLKVRLDGVYAPSVTIPHYLLEQGIEQVVAPIPTTTGDLWATLDSFSLILYPFIDGQEGMEIGLSDRQWTEFGAALRKLHAIRLPSDLADQVRKEDFVPNPKWSAVAKRLHAEVPQREYTNPYQNVLAVFWRERHDEIGRLVDRAEELGRLLQGHSLDFVLCHADIHTANLLITPEDRLFIVDWDQPILAPKERDLMFVLGAVGGDARTPRQEDLFFQGYGGVQIDALAMAYYRYEWVVQEIGAWGEDVFLRDDVGDETRQDSAKHFRYLFEPGDVVEAAYQSEGRLSG